MSRLEGLALGMAWASRPWPGRFGSKNQGSTLWGGTDGKDHIYIVCLGI